MREGQLREGQLRGERADGQPSHALSSGPARAAAEGACDSGVVGLRESAN